jgi:RNA polymerase primary sigma factor
MEQAIDKTALYQVPKNIPSNHADRQNSHALSYDAPLGHRTNMSLLSVLVNPNAPIADERVYSEAMKQAIERALEGLDARESRVVNAFFAIDREHETMAEIAEDMGLKRERVRQIRDKAVRKLRKSFKAYLRSNNTTFST